MSLVLLLPRTPCLLSGSQWILLCDRVTWEHHSESCVGGTPHLPGILACSPSSPNHSAAYRYSSESHVGGTPHCLGFQYVLPAVQATLQLTDTVFSAKMTVKYHFFSELCHQSTSPQNKILLPSFQHYDLWSQPRFVVLDCLVDRAESRLEYMNTHTQDLILSYEGITFHLRGFSFQFLTFWLL